MNSMKNFIKQQTQKLLIKLQTVCFKLRYLLIKLEDVKYYKQIFMPNNLVYFSCFHSENIKIPKVLQCFYFSFAVTTDTKSLNLIQFYQFKKLFFLMITIHFWSKFGLKKPKVFNSFPLTHFFFSPQIYILFNIQVLLF